MITTQLAMLKQRGLIVSDEDTALKQLASISYFRLASYDRSQNRPLICIVSQCFINVISNITLPSKGLSPTDDRYESRALHRE